MTKDQRPCKESNPLSLPTFRGAPRNPFHGFPDFATIRIRYIPDQKLVELKSLKLYINKFRDQEIFHEAAVNRILDDLVALLEPRWMEVVGDFNVRGNIKTVVTARHVAKGYSPNGRG